MLSLTRRGWYAALPVSRRKKWHVLKDASKEIPMLYAANTSKLVNIMNKLLELVVRTAGNDLDIEILEMHDQWKKGRSKRNF